MFTEAVCESESESEFIRADVKWRLSDKLRKVKGGRKGGGRYGSSSLTVKSCSV
jgi:hypothetical protein